MAGVIQFNRNFAAFGNQVNPWEKSDTVGQVITELLCIWGYPVGELIEAKISGIWLGEGERPENDPDKLDIIFKMRTASPQYYEIVLRTEDDAWYGGFFEGQSLEVTDEIVNGHRVVYAINNGMRIRYEFYTEGFRGFYMPVFDAAKARRSTRQVRESLRRRAR